MASWWYLSFADANGWKGVCLVESTTVLGAISIAHLRSINPGGEVMPVGPIDYDIPDMWTNRLITDKSELEDFDRALGGSGEVETIRGHG